MAILIQLKVIVQLVAVLIAQLEVVIIEQVKVTLSQLEAVPFKCMLQSC